jgi:hypothetical protein
MEAVQSLVSSNGYVKKQRDVAQPILITLIVVHALSASAALFFIVISQVKPSLFYAGRIGIVASSYWFVTSSSCLGVGGVLLYLFRQPKEEPIQEEKNVETIDHAVGPSRPPSRIGFRLILPLEHIEEKLSQVDHAVGPSRPPSRSSARSPLMSERTFRKKFDFEEVLEKIEEEVEVERNLREEEMAALSKEKLFAIIERGYFVKPGEHARFLSLEQIGWLQPPQLEQFHLQELNAMISPFPIKTKRSEKRFAHLSHSCVDYLLQNYNGNEIPFVMNISPDQIRHLKANITDDHLKHIFYSTYSSVELVRQLFSHFPNRIYHQFLERGTKESCLTLASEKQLRSIPLEILKKLNAMTMHVLFSPFDQDRGGYKRFNLLTEDQKKALLENPQGESLKGHLDRKLL